MSVLVAIINYRTPQLTIDCLASLAAPDARPANTHVVVVDNASGDNSIALIEQAIVDNGWGEWATFRPLPKNGGFAYGNNEAIRPALAGENPPKHLLLLNSDTVVRAGAIQALVDVLDARPEVGIVGSRLEFPDGTPQHSVFRFPSLLSECDEALRVGVVHRALKPFIIMPPISDQPCAADWVAGASMLIRREVFETIGMMDERFFLYYEEVDYCLRAARAGWKCWYEPKSRVIHLIGQSSGVTNEQARLKPRPRYWFDSRRHYFLENYGRAYLMLVDTVWSASYALGQGYAWLRRKPNLDPPRFFRDYLANSVFVRGWRQSHGE